MNKLTDHVLKYHDIIKDLLQRVITEEIINIERASDLIVESFSRGGLLYVFGTGHSMLMSLELFHRAGGLVRVYPLIDLSLLGVNGALKASYLERLTGYARALLASINIIPGSVMLIISNSGKNAGPVEMAYEALRRGMKIIAVTSIEYSKKLPPDNSLGKKLYELADVVIDNKVPEGDAVVEIEGLDTKIAPVSTIVNAFILNSIVIRVVEKSIERGIEPEVWMSSNIPGGIERNEKYREKYINIIKPL